MGSGYDATTVPASGTDRSRYALDRSPAGVTGLSPAQTIANVYGSLLDQRIRELEPRQPALVRVALKKIALDSTGAPVLVEAGTVEAEPTHVSVYDGPDD